MINITLFRQIWRRHWVKVAFVTAGALLWGFLFPVIYASFVTDLQSLKGLPSGVTHFGTGDILSLTGFVAVGFDHPFFLALVLIIVMGVSVPVIAGQRQRGTLENLLARPLRRTTLFTTALVVVAQMLAIVVAAYVIGAIIGTRLENLHDQLPTEWLPLVWLNAYLLFGAFMSLGLAASAMSNRTGPAISLCAFYIMINYFVEIIGSFWNAAQPYQKYSLFDHFQPKAILSGSPAWLDFALLGVCVVIPLIYALIMFPRRDIPAPS